MVEFFILITLLILVFFLAVLVSRHRVCPSHVETVEHVTQFTRRGIINASVH